MAWAQTTLNMIFNITSYLKIHNASFGIDVTFYQVKLLRFNNVQTMNLTFASKI